MKTYKEVKTELEETEQKQEKLKKLLVTLIPTEIWVSYFKEDSQPGLHFTEDHAKKYYPSIQTSIQHYILAP